MICSRLWCSTLFFLLISVLSFAQKAPVKWNDIPEEDISMTIYDADSSASAVILCDYGDATFEIQSNNIQIKYTYHKRIKILKESGFDYADVSIPYYDKYHKITNLKAQVVLPDGKRIEVDKKDIFTEKISDYLSAEKIAFPNISPGVIIEYKYHIVSESLLKIREWYFEYEIPVRWSEFRTTIPDWYNYVAISQGTAPLKVEKNSKQENYRLRVGQSRSSVRSGVSAMNSGVQNLPAKVITTQYILEKAPAIRREEYISTMKDYRTRIAFQLQSIQYPYSTVRPVLSTWPKVAEELAESPSFGLQISKKKNYKNIWSQVEGEVSKLGTKKEKVEFLYNFVTQNMEWDGYNSIYTTESLNKAFEKKKGDTGDINIMLLALLKEAGVTAYPILSSTRSHGKMQQIYPIIDQFNHVFVYADLDGKEVFMDATDTNRPINYLRENALNSIGWLVDGNNSQWVNVYPQKGGTTFFSTLSLDDEGTLKGNMKMKFDGYAAIDERIDQETSPDGKSWKKRLTDLYPDISIEAVNYKGIENINKSLTASIEMEVPEKAQVAGDFIYLNPIIYTSIDENPFKIENRTYPVNIPYPTSEKNIINIELPEGFVPEELPEPAKVVLPNKGGSFVYSVSQNGNKLQISSSVRINQLIYEPTEYGSIRGFFEMIVEKQNEQIVLKKKT